jgi:hypothetical protein
MLEKRMGSTVLLLLSLALPAASLAADLKPRIIMLTDISPVTVEPDDMESMIRLMVHADLFEIEGLVATTGWSNSGGQEHPDLIKNVIDAYEKDLPGLRRRSGEAAFRHAAPLEVHRGAGHAGLRCQPHDRVRQRPNGRPVQ